MAGTRRVRWSCPAGVAVLAMAAVLAMLLSAGRAEAARVRFGADESLHKLSDVDFAGPNREKLYLGYKTTTHFFLLPYSISDDGYVIGVEGKRQYRKLEADELAYRQGNGQLPKPLPAYQLSAMDYAMGHLLWLMLPVVGIVIWFGVRKEKRQKAAVPHIVAAIGHHQAGRGQEALAEYTQALAIHADNPLALMNRGRLLEAMGQPDAAVTDYSRVIKAVPKHAEALLSRGATFQRMGQLERALSDLTRAVKASKAAVAYQARAGVHFQRGDMKAALKDMTAAIGKEPRAAILYAQRGEVHERLGNAAEAGADRATAQRLAAEAAPAQAAEPAGA